MFLHLGADTVIPVKNVIAIIEFRDSRSKINSDFIKKITQRNSITDVSEGTPKSFVLTDKGVFLSTISSTTLKKRAGSFNTEEDEEE
jgi:hypothetical protein